MATAATPKKVQTLEQAVIRFAGDSGDGIQVTGNQFTSTSAVVGNDLATFPDFPAEIRAPLGTVAGVSGFQVRFSSIDIQTPGDAPDVLVVYNPAALKANIADVVPNGTVIVNTGSFGERDLKKAGYDHNPLEDDSLEGYRVVEVNMNARVYEALKDTGLDKKSIGRCKNFYALGMTYWLYQRPLETTLNFINKKFKSKPQIAEANCKALKAGYNYADIAGLFQTVYEVPAAPLVKGTYRNIQGNTAISLGFLAASKLSGLDLFLGSYPITPASDILHKLSRYKAERVVTFQAEDEIAAIAAVIGAAFAGKLALTTTSGPGLALKSEAMGLAIITELPMVICNVQRGGPSTGLPTKTEQSDLLQAVYGRHGESPMPVLSASSAADCFDTTLEACRIALKYMTPVLLLSDGYIANGSEPWRLPEIETLEPIPVKFHTDRENFHPYQRDPKTLARPWAVPGTPGCEHRLGGLEKEAVTGKVSYDAENHSDMVHARAEKVARIADHLPTPEVDGPEQGRLLVLGWGSTRGAIVGAVNRARKAGLDVARVHLRHLYPFPTGLKKIIKSYDKVLIPEMNLGQLVKLIRSEYLIKAIPLSKVKGKPFTTAEILKEIKEILRD